MNTEVFDYIIIGSGFGGSVAALRLSEKGYKVLVLEKGKRFDCREFPESDWNLKRFLYFPSLGFKGILQLRFFRHMFVLSGSGMGGGSLVYANTLMEPAPETFQHVSWSRNTDWKNILKPHFQKARQMLGSVLYSCQPGSDDLALKKVAVEMGQESTFSTIEAGVYFGPSDTDPYFKGLGPLRNGCTLCAGCMTGCRENAKNSLDKNYLYFAEKFGAKLLADTKAWKIDYTDGIYSIMASCSGPFTWKKYSFKSKGLIISAGVMGTMELLMKQKHRYRSLPMLSDKLGQNIRTNSQSMSGIVNAREKMNHGLAITSVFSPVPGTRVELVKFNDRSGSVTHLSGFACESPSQWKRAFKQVILTLGKPALFLRLLFNPRWCRNSFILLVMQTADHSMSMKWKKHWWGDKLQLINENGRVPAYIRVGQEVLYKLAGLTGGIAMNSIMESLFGMSTTAHILGGCPMGTNHDLGVVNERFEVHGYPGMYIIDSSIVPSNLGVNPSLTITALSEYACSLIPEKEGNQQISLDKLMEEVGKL